MSYILDALKKAEAERDPQARARLAIEQTEGRKHRLLIYGVILALMANAVVLTWLFYPDMQRVVSARPIAQQTSGRSTSATEQPTPQTPAAPRASKIERTTLKALPAAVAARLPRLEFSSHIFAEDADLRAVVVNGQRLEEGDRIGAVTLVEITEDGAVMAFERYLITVPVLENWN
ncbi:MAG: general secretion pathway protein GspB [Pseudomonadales bacterium]